MPFCLVALGSNLGNRQATLDAAVASLASDPSVAIVACSRWLETQPVGGPAGQNAFLNGALLLETSLAPHELLARLQRVEDQLGRQRPEPWGPRTIDLDLLLYDDLVLNTPSLVLPHPRMAFRRFVLAPAAEVAGAMPHPTIRWTTARLLTHLNTSAPYVAVTGPIAAGKTRLARRLAETIAGRLLVERPDWHRMRTFYDDPVEQGFETELGFVNHRARLLRKDATPDEPNSRPGWTISDFWFDQSAAFARAWLPAEQQAEFLERYEQLRWTVVAPRLIVLLDSPVDELLGRIRRRGRQCEKHLTGEQLDCIRRAIVEQTKQPDIGPVLHLANDDHDAAFTEVLAAVRGME
jgi:2-amino-4-hydroxy-6-hydroxymethyldihydropteridine diphosphokinase